MRENLIEESKEALIQWNNAYPLDRPYRQKYNIAFNSEQHRKVDQIDVFMEWLEKRLYTEMEEEIVSREKEKKDLSQGKWLKDRGDHITTEEELELFDKIQF